MNKAKSGLDIARFRRMPTCLKTRIAAALRLEARAIAAYQNKIFPCLCFHLSFAKINLRNNQIRRGSDESRLLPIFVRALGLLAASPSPLQLPPRF